MITILSILSLHNILILYITIYYDILGVSIFVAVSHMVLRTYEPHCDWCPTAIEPQCREMCSTPHKQKALVPD